MLVTGGQDFELGTGLGRYWFGWVINLQGIWLGLLLFPRVVFAGFVRGRRSGSVFRQHDCNAELLGRTVGELRDTLPTAPKQGHTRRPSDFIAFGAMLLLSLVVYLPLLALGIWIVAVAVQQF